MGYGPGGDPGPLGNPVWSQEENKRLEQLMLLDEKLKGVRADMLDVEQHIIDRLKAESGASNIKLLAEALDIVTKLRRSGK